MSKQELIRRRLREDILRGRYGSGEPIPERTVAEELDVSRIPVREALIQLERDGLVSIVPRRGAYVRTFSADNLQSLYETREALEGMASRLAAQRMAPETMAPFMEEYEAVLAGSTKLDETAITALGDEFHGAIIASSRNSTIIEMATTIADRSHLARRMSYDHAPVRGRFRAVEEHLGIAEAIVRRDPDLAEQRMREHIVAWAQFVRMQTVGDVDVSIAD